MSKFRLLSKREIDAAKAKDRLREIEEGKKLATRVDTLRETAANEESSLEEFRIKQLTAIQDEINPKIAENAALDTAIREKRAERERLLKPLDEAWEAVRVEKKAVDEKDEAVVQKDAQLKLSIAANIQRERDNEVEKGRIADERSRASEALIQATKLHTEAKTTLKDAKEKSAIITAALDLREKEVEKREFLATTAMNHFAERTKLVDAYEDKLFISEQHLKEGWKDFINTKNKYVESRNSDRNDSKRVAPKR